MALPKSNPSIALGESAGRTTAGETISAPTAAARTRSRGGTTGWAPAVFLAIPLALYLVWVIGPMFFTFWMSLTDTDGLSGGNFVGFDNYRRLFDEREFWFAFWNNVRWLLAYIIIPTVCGLGLALLLNNNLPGIRFIKAGFFSPLVLSSVVISAVWSWMYFPNDGLINATIAALGYDGSPIPFLADYTYDGAPLSWFHDIGLFRWVEHINLVSWSIIGAGIWRQIGYIMLIYLAGLNNVDSTLVEASRIDGAGRLRSFKDIVLPQLQPVTVIVIVISIIDALRSFDLVNIMTDGGPANRSSVLAHQMYIEAFNNYEMGFGASFAVILSLMSGLFIFSYLRHMVKNELEY